MGISQKTKFNNRKIKHHEKYTLRSTLVRNKILLKLNKFKNPS